MGVTILYEWFNPLRSVNFRPFNLMTLSFASSLEVGLLPSLQLLFLQAVQHFLGLLSRMERMGSNGL